MSEKTVHIRGGWAYIGASVFILTLVGVFVFVLMPLAIVILAIFALVMAVLWAVESIKRRRQPRWTR